MQCFQERVEFKKMKVVKSYAILYYEFFVCYFFMNYVTYLFIFPWPLISKKKIFSTRKIYYLNEIIDLLNIHLSWFYCIFSGCWLSIGYCSLQCFRRWHVWLCLSYSYGSVWHSSCTWGDDFSHEIC